MTFHDALKSVSLCFREEEEREDRLMERERESEKLAVSFLDRATHFLESKPASTGGLPARRRRVLPLCHLSALFVYRQNTVDRAH